MLDKGVVKAVAKEMVDDVGAEEKAASFDGSGAEKVSSVGFWQCGWRLLSAPQQAQSELVLL